MKKFHYVYRTINLINGMIYYGAHSSNSLEDGYLGSGVALNRAVKKYGRSNFIREILGQFDTPEQMFDYERKIITEEVVKDRNTYNQRVGGNGERAITEHMRMKLSNALKGRTFSEESRQKMSAAQKGRKHTEESKRKMSEARKGRKPSASEIEKRAAALRGRKHSEEARNKMSLAKTARSLGVPLSEEHKAAIGRANLGKKRTPEQREKMREGIRRARLLRESGSK